MRTLLQKNLAFDSKLRIEKERLKEAKKLLDKLINKKSLSLEERKLLAKIKHEMT